MLVDAVIEDHDVVVMGGPVWRDRNSRGAAVSSCIRKRCTNGKPLPIVEIAEGNCGEEAQVFGYVVMGMRREMFVELMTMIGCPS